jgi:hypothetical protein
VSAQSKRETEAAGEPCKEAEKKETVLGKALKSSVFAFSLDETRAKEGYDAEGVRKLLPLGGNYRLPEVWRTMKLTSTMILSPCLE